MLRISFYCHSVTGGLAPGSYNPTSDPNPDMEHDNGGGAGSRAGGLSIFGSSPMNNMASPFGAPSGIPQHNGSGSGNSNNANTGASVAFVGNQNGAIFSQNLHHSSSGALGRDIGRLLDDQLSPDFEITIQGETIAVHKCILVARCNYFASCLLSGMVEAKKNKLVVPADTVNMTHSAFKAFLRFVFLCSFLFCNSLEANDRFREVT